MSSISRLPIFYFFLWLSACGGGGGGGAPGDIVDPNPSNLAAPTGVTATAGDAQIDVSWATVAGATSYNIYVNDAGFVSKTSYIRLLTSATSPVTISGLVNGQLHTVMVTATDSSSESSDSISDQATPQGAPPGPVTDFLVTPGNKQIGVSWTAVSGATGYEVDYAEDAAFTVNKGTLATNSTSYTFTGLSNGVTYYYRILSTNGNGSSAWSSTVSAVPDLASGWNVKEVPSSRLLGAFEAYYDKKTHLNSNRKALISWSHGTTTYSTVYAVTYDPATDWSTATTISITDGFDSGSSLSDNGEAAVIWSERTYLDPDNLTWRHDIYVKHYQGGVWGSAVPLSSTESGQYPGEPVVQLDSSGNAVAIWHGDDGNYYSRTYNRLSDTWATVNPINSSSNPYVGRPFTALDSSDRIIVAWDEKPASTSSTNKIFVRRYTDSGGWETTMPINIDDPMLDAGNYLYDMSANANGDIFVLWAHKPAGDYELKLRKYSAAGTTWNSEIAVDTSNFAMDWGSVRADPAGNSVVYWKKRIDDTVNIIESDNLAVYHSATVSMGPIEEMPTTTDDIYSLTPSAFGTGLFRAHYSTNAGAVHAYERIYDFAAQTWSTAVSVQDYFGREDYQLVVNGSGAAILTTFSNWFDYGTLKSYLDVRASFYMP
ncbi:MAG: fibronectin type III domain-containing protein [Gammaproteobacteria bacterium]|nr:fibronectin type III domain-containing protein [Gammaproteobacteria bacterium]MDH5802833.1 fibronectin type III domain-containing protein [Gammaproteobacteria bacterium]